MQPVLICTLPLDVKEVMTQLHSETGVEIDSGPTESKRSRTIEHLVVVDDEEYPIGCIPIAKLLKATVLPQSFNTAQLIEPIRNLPVSTSLQEFWQTLEASSPEARVHWGVTDLSGKEVLGLIDLPRILPALANDQARAANNLIATPSKTNSNSNQQLQVEKLMVESRLKSKLLSEVSHDLKNPLTAILGLFNILQQSKLDQVTERQQRYLELIDEKTYQLMTVVQKVMLLSQLQNHQFIPQLEVVDIQLLCQQAIESFTQRTPTAKENLPHVQIRIAEQLPVLIADRSCLKQILCALIKQVSIPVNEPITLQVESWGGWIGFTLSTAQNVMQIEEVQYNTKQPDSLNSSTEINLLDQQLAHQLAQLHQGVICNSGNALASRQLTLLITPNLAKPPTDAADLSQLSQQLALIIATDLDIIGDLQSSLEKLGYRVAIAQSDNDALALPQKLQPAVTFVHKDFTLPSGGNIFRLIKTSCQTTLIRLGKPSSEKQAAQPFIDFPITHQAIANCLENLSVEAPASRIQNHSAKETKNKHDSAPAKPLQPKKRLTILHLETHTQQNLPSDSRVPRPVFNLHSCQVISIESLEEAPLLLQIWKPQVILYTGIDLPPLQQIDQQSPLTQLPLVVTDPDVATQAKQLSPLKVYECPISSDAQAKEENSKALARILQIAADRGQAPYPML